jgi:predicted permease
MRNLWMRLRSLFLGGSLDRELSQEIESHIAMQEEEFLKKGMTPAAARAAALREFGGVTQTAEVYRERRGLPWIETAAKDVRYALRGLRRNPGFTVAAVLSLALGIGANTAIFSLFHALMLRMLPVASPQELVSFYRTGGFGMGGSVSYPLCLDFNGRRDLFQGVAAFSGLQRVQFSEKPGGRMEFVEREYVSGNYFDVLGVRSYLGRFFRDEDNRVPQGHPLVILSYEFWHNRFGADRSILGRTLVVDEQVLTVVGVAAPGFRGAQVEGRADLWEPVMMYRGEVMSPNMFWLRLVGRSQPAISRRQLQAAVTVALQQRLQALYGSNGNAAFRKMMMSQRLELREAGVGVSLLRDLFGKPLTILMWTVSLVLLATCANLANLLLARGAARAREVALRFSLGATRSRLVRQALTESAVLAGLGSLFGILLAFWGTHFVLGFLPASEMAFDAAPDALVLAFTLGISLLAVVLFGLAPAMRTTDIDPARGLHAAAGRSANRHAALRRPLVMAQVAFSVVLVGLGSLFGRSLAALYAVDLGFHHQDAVALTLGFPRSWKPAQRRATHDQLLARIQALPGVLSASYGFPAPFANDSSSASIRVPGSEATAKDPVWVNVASVAPRYFETLGAPLIGREFDATDTEKSRKVAVVDEAFVHKFLPAERNVVGRILSFDDKPEGGEPTYIVGVVRQVRQQNPREIAEATVYRPSVQSDSEWDPTIVVRPDRPAAALLPFIRRELEILGPQVALSEPTTLRERVARTIFQDRLLAMLGGFFGLLALLLAGIGLYGVVAYETERRSSEIGIRIALGAERGSVLWMVLRDALLLVAAGFLVGLPCAMAAGRMVSAVLFGIKPGDPSTFVFTGGVLLVAGLAAAFLPARHAARMDPMWALRHE